MTKFCFPLPDQHDISTPKDCIKVDKYQKFFIGNNFGEIFCFTWDGQDLLEENYGKEICKNLAKCLIHDDEVIVMIKCHYLEDVFLTVGGDIFALWKEDLVDGPIFCKKSSNRFYSGGCWSSRFGIFLLTTVDAYLEVWDLKRNDNEPVLLKVVSGQVL